MKNFRTLVFFELKKILSRKMTWIAFGIVFLTMVALGVFRVVVSHEVDGVQVTAYEEEMQKKEKQQKISGQKVDDELVETMFTAMTTSKTAFGPYESFYNDMCKWLCGTAMRAGTVKGAKEVLGISDEEELIYAARRMKIETGLDEQYLTEAEKEYWRNALTEEKSVPWTYEYYQGMQFVWVAAYTAVVLIAIMLAVCLANLFAEEHQKKTDQLVLCSRNGRKVLYLAKITAGMLFTMGSTGLILLVTAVPQLIIFGTEGLQASIQLMIPTSMLQMTFGEAILYSYFLTIIASFLYSSIILCCSELFRNGTVAVVAVVVVMVLIPMMVVVPYEYRILSQIFDLNPTNVVAIWSATDYRLVPVPGGYLTVQQVAPILYALMSTVFIFIGRRAYLKYQVGGR